MSSSNLSKVCMAATSVVIVQCHTDQSFKWNFGLRSLQLSKNRFYSGRNSNGVINGSVSSGNGGVEEIKRKQADDSLQTVMYLSCWGQS
ncbi:Protein of unknown function wound-induced [Macleaya cordata]|uniref:Wound-responsive family protein n=1 Tax=Macleaya cordata TaxID=56857 RepID=A0A200QVH2_MACCD|nr:Protein of unknown function wound-induced [Macleaya cordata]